MPAKWEGQPWAGFGVRAPSHVLQMKRPVSLGAWFSEGSGSFLERFGAAAAGRHRSAVDSRRVRASHLAEIVVVSKV